MCGIAGFIGSAPEQGMRAQVCCMAGQLTHRGPDDSGLWVDAEAGIALGFRRLAILDLSPAGRQPMTSSDGRYVMVFNGEVYNFADMRAELEPLGHTFRGHSDTEVMLEAVSEWGLEAAVKKFVCKFAYALWDRRERVLHLVRDRLGIKPLYCGWQGRTFLFGSELKALRAHPDFRQEVSPDAAALYLRLGYIPYPYSIYRGIWKLPPGHILSLQEGAQPASELPRTVCYWSADDIYANGAADPFRGSELEAIDELDRLLRESTRLRMIADVPLGAFLSGGIDSSTVVALMQAQSTRPVKTFTIGFREQEFDEASHAKAVAAHLGTHHTELYVTAEQARDVIPKLPTLYDEPFGDSSQIPTYLLSALTRRHVTVSLSGDGGDELFGGYPRYARIRRFWGTIRCFPYASRIASARLLRACKPATYNRLFGGLGRFLPRLVRPSTVGDRVYRLAETLAARNPDEIYCGSISYWKSPAQVVSGAIEPPTVLSRGPDGIQGADLCHRFMLLDLLTYLPEDILAKLDRASMAVSLEARVPILDHRVVEFAARVPTSMKVRSGMGKWLLRQVLHRYVPRELVERPKMGFSVPIEDWVRGPLRDWAESLLNPARLRSEGFLQAEPIREVWDEHLSGQRNWHGQLWNVLMFQAWREKWA
ncbi:MAG: asparagine synthase (glutamine-hydrolyzing) [Terriglobia bacterium]